MDGVKLPKNIENQTIDSIKEICGDSTEKYLSEKFIPIQFFRDLYKKDVQLFSIFVKELSLRGGKFHLASPSPLFPVNKIQNDTLTIHVPDHLDALSYKKINYSMINLQQVMDQFSIKSNAFYQGIPIEGFKNLNVTDLDFSLLTNEFERVGFIISDSLTSAKLNLEKHTIEDLTSEKVKDELSIYSHSNFLLSISSIHNIFPKDYADCLSKSSFNDVKDLISPEGIDFINQMNSKETTQLAKYLRQFYRDKELMSRYCIQLLDNYLTEENNCLTRLLFEENKWNMVNNVMSQLNILSLSQLTYSSLFELFNSKGVGVTKVIGFLDTIYTYLTDGKPTIPIVMGQNNQLGEKKYFSLGWVSNYQLNREYIDDSIYYATYDSLKGDINNLSIKKKDKKRLYQEAEERLESITRKVAIPNEILHQNDDLYLSDLIEIFDLTFDDKFRQTEDYHQFKQMEHQTISFIFKETTKVTCFYECLVNYYYSQLVKFMSIETIIDDFLENEKERIIFVNRLQDNLTLEETGKILGVTRERVRQLEKKQRLMFLEIIKNNGIEVFKYYLKKEGLIDFSLLGDNLITILESVQDNFDFQVSREFRLILSKKELDSLSSLQEFVHKIVNRKKYISIKKISNRLDMIQNKKLVDFIVNNKETLLEKNGLEEYHDVFIPTKIGKAEFSVIILSLFYDNQTIDLGNEQEVEKFYHYYSPVFPDATSDFENLSRSIMGFFDRQQDSVIKIDSNTYKILDVENMQTEIIDRVASFVRSELVDDDVMYLKRVYKEFEDLLEENGITQFEIYYYLRLFYSEEFDFGSGNTMRIFQKGIEKKSTEDIIYSKLLDFGGSVEVNEITDYLGVERYTIEQTAYTSDKMMIKNSKLVRMDALTSYVSQELIDILKEKCRALLDKQGYVISKKLFEELIFDSCYSELLNESRIHNSEGLLQLLKSIIPGVRGHSKFIYYANQKIETINIYLDHISEKDKFQRDDFYKVGESLGYSLITSNSLVVESIDNGILVPIDDIYLVRKDQFTIDEQRLHAVDQYIKENVMAPGYLSCVHQKGLRRKLPPLENYAWTSQLLFYVATQHLSYQKIEIKGVPHNVNPLIISEKNSELNYNKIVLHQLEMYEGNNHEDTIGQYLFSKGLIATKNKQIPSHLFDEEVLEKDDIGFITILQ